jgi:hypothetical protein
MNQENNKNQRKRMEIKIADNIPGAEYANLMKVGHNKEEFQLIFMNVMPPSGRVVGKIVTSPGHFKRMVSAMQENLKMYEDKIGKVEEAESPQGIGFKA